MGVLSWDRNNYAYSNLTHFHTTADIRKEYSRLRKIANKRIARLGASEFRGSAAYQFNKAGFPALKGLSDTEIQIELSAVASFLSAKSSSITGQRAMIAESLKTLHEHGYTFVNKSNFNDFVAFMESVRQAAVDSGISSEEVAEYFDEMTKTDLQVEPEELKADFLDYIENDSEF